LEKWAAGHHLTFRQPNEKPESKKNQSPPPITEGLLSAMQRGGVFYDVDADDIQSALAACTKQLSQFPEASRQILFQRLLEREQLMPTGVGKGVAIPHPRTPLEKMGDNPILPTFFLKEPIQFGAIDDKPVFVLFVLLSPTTREHLNLLSRLAFCVRDDAFVSFLKTAPEAEALFVKIEAFEQQLDRS
jgi:PTS system nitrogen regulatory IIA component